MATKQIPDPPTPGGDSDTIPSAPVQGVQSNGGSARFKLGRRPPKNAPALKLGRFLTGVVPGPPAAEDYGSDFTGWLILGNDTVGDCVAVTWANQRVLVTAALTGTPSYPTQDQVWALYKTQNPSFNPHGNWLTGPGSIADGGMDIQTTLEHLTGGGPDGVRAIAFAGVDHTNEYELRAAHAIFGQVWYGVTVQDANQTQFHNGQEWDYIPGSAVDGAHSVTGVGYDASNYQIVTWGAEISWTENFRTHLVNEAWVVIWPENLGTTQFVSGVNHEQLASDYYAITGNPLPLPELAGIGYAIAINDDTITLATLDPNAGLVSRQLGMMTGTSPAVTDLGNNHYAIAFQANTGNLWTIDPIAGAVDRGLGMMAGTSPAITALTGNQYAVAFQANTGNLWTLDPDLHSLDRGLGMMHGTSPAICYLRNRSYAVAFQANTGNLWTLDPDLHSADRGLGMMAGTSPALARLTTNRYATAFQANTGTLWTLDPFFGSRDRQQRMNAGTSPAVTVNAIAPVTGS